MSNKSYHAGEMLYQIGQINELMKDQMNRADGIMAAISSYVDNPDLQGEAYDSIRTRMVDVHGTIWRGIKACARSVIEDNEVLIKAYRARLDAEYINGIEVTQSIEELNEQNQYLLRFPETFITDELIAQNSSVIRYLQGLLDRLDDFDYATSTLFEEANHYLKNVEIGLAQIDGDGGWNESTKTFDTIEDTSWMIEINYKAMGLDKYITPEGEITEAGKDYFEDIMKKDIGEVSTEELYILSVILMNARSAGDVEDLMKYGYCIPVEVEGETYPTYAASEVFKLSLLLANQNLIDEGIDNLEDSEFAWNDYNNRIALNLLMVSAVAQIDQVLDFTSTIDYKVFNVEYNLYDNTGKYTLMFIQTLAHPNTKTTVTSDVIAFGEKAEIDVINGVFDAMELSDKVDYAIGLLSYLYGIGPTLGHIMTVADGLDTFGLSHENIKEISSRGKSKRLDGKEGREAIISAAMADKLGLSVYKVDGKYYLGVSQTTSESLAEINADINQLKNGIEEDYYDKEAYEGVKDDFEALGYTLEKDANGVRTIKGLENIDVNDLYEDLEKVDHIYSIKMAFSNMMTNQEKGITE